MLDVTLHRIGLVTIPWPKEVTAIATIENEETFTRTFAFKERFAQAFHAERTLRTKRTALAYFAGIEVVGGQKDFAFCSIIASVIGVAELERLAMTCKVQEHKIVLVWPVENAFLQGSIDSV